MTAELRHNGADTPAKHHPVGLIAGGGALPFAVADALVRQGRPPVLFAVKGVCDAAAISRYKHHWIALGQFGRLFRMLHAEGCRDLVFIGTLVRPAISEVRMDWTTLKMMPRLLAAFRGGDDHLLSGVGGIFEREGVRLLGIRDVAPDLLMPAGQLTRAVPKESAMADIAKGRELLLTLSPFDIGQACVVIDGHVVGVEDIEGTDGLLERVKRLRDAGRIRAQSGRGVLVKAPKANQDLRFDLPAAGPRTVEGAAAAGLAGIAIVAGHTIVAEPQAMVEAADRANLFIAGLPA